MLGVNTAIVHAHSQRILFSAGAASRLGPVRKNNDVFLVVNPGHAFAACQIKKTHNAILPHTTLLPRRGKSFCCVSSSSKQWQQMIDIQVILHALADGSTHLSLIFRIANVEYVSGAKAKQTEGK